MSRYIDAHCHILDGAQMRDADMFGVERFVVNATSPADWATVIDLSQYDNVYGAIGVHPWYVSEQSVDWDMTLIKLLSENSHLMVGEIGLDKNRPDFATQETVFCRQLQIAHDMGRVAHIHCVGAWGKMLDFLRVASLPPSMVFHAFSGSPEMVKELTNMGSYFSFGLSVKDLKHRRLRLSVAAVPDSRILVESDNESPNTIPDTVSEIARIRGVSDERMAEIIYKNTMGVLNDNKI